MAVAVDEHKMLVDVRVTDQTLDALIASGRIRWSQRNDMLAVGKALNKLLRDIAAGTEPASADARARARQIFWNPP